MLSESDFKHGNNRIKVTSLIDDFSLNVIDEDVKNIQHEMINLRVAILQMLCLENLYREKKRIMKIGVTLQLMEKNF